MRKSKAEEKEAICDQFHFSMDVVARHGTSDDGVKEVLQGLLHDQPAIPLSSDPKKFGDSVLLPRRGLSLQIQQQQFDIDRLVSPHMEKVRIEIDEKRKRRVRRILEALEEEMMKRLRVKEEVIEKLKLTVELFSLYPSVKIVSYFP